MRCTPRYRAQGMGCDRQAMRTLTVIMGHLPYACGCAGVCTRKKFAWDASVRNLMSLHGMVCLTRLPSMHVSAGVTISAACGWSASLIPHPLSQFSSAGFACIETRRTRRQRSSHGDKAAADAPKASPPLAALEPTPEPLRRRLVHDMLVPAFVVYPAVHARQLVANIPVE